MASTTEAIRLTPWLAAITASTTTPTPNSVAPYGTYDGIPALIQPAMHQDQREQKDRPEYGEADQDPAAGSRRRPAPGE